MLLRGVLFAGDDGSPDALALAPSVAHDLPELALCSPTPASASLLAPGAAVCTRSS
ncbi:MAG: hypothetical protein ACLTYW_07505 [Collinsella sp.]